jgi:hypothetical protein
MRLLPPSSGRWLVEAHHLWNVRKFLHPRRLSSANSPPWEPETPKNDSLHYRDQLVQDVYEIISDYSENHRKTTNTVCSKMQSVNIKVNLRGTNSCYCALRRYKTLPLRPWPICMFILKGRIQNAVTPRCFISQASNRVNWRTGLGVRTTQLRT